MHIQSRITTLLLSSRISALKEPQVEREELLAEQGFLFRCYSRVVTVKIMTLRDVFRHISGRSSTPTLLSFVMSNSSTVLF